MTSPIYYTKPSITDKEIEIRHCHLQLHGSAAHGLGCVRSKAR